MKFANRILGLMALVLMVGYLAAAQQQQLSIGENTKLNANGLFTFGYSGDYGDAVPSDHGLNFGGSGEVSGYYYNPNFISFSATPYYNQSRADSSYQSITGASGVTGTANLFSGTHFPGSVSYNYTENSTGTFGLTGQPNFTTYGRGNGFGINWSALVPDLPTLSVGYTQGSGSGTIYGTDQESKSSQRMFNAHSNYQIEGFRLNAFFTHNSFNSEFPEFLAGEQDQFQNSSGHDFGFSAIHALPMRGTFSASYDRASATSNSMANEAANEGTSNSSSYTDDNESASVSFSPTRKFSFNVSQNYVGNLSGYLTQSLSSNGIPQEEVGLGAGSHSVTLGAGANYQFTNFLSSSLQATYYDQFYFGHSYTGEYLAGTVNYNKRLWDMLSFSGSVIDSSNGQGQNALGFIGNANFFRGFGHWATSGQFSYAQNVQTVLITYTTSYYQYRASLTRRLPKGLQWTGSFSGSHSGLTNDPGSNSSSRGYATALSAHRLSINGVFSQSSGVSVLGVGGLIVPNPTPGLTNFIISNGSSYGGGITVNPVSRLSITGNFSRAISNTFASTISHNDQQLYNAQLQYHLRRIGLQAGYLRFTQGISAIGAPATTTSFYVGMNRWFNFF